MSKNSLIVNTIKAFRQCPVVSTLNIQKSEYCVVA
nr:MAG TPA: hypothetical protein [Caudoviricetes sp.]